MTRKTQILIVDDHPAVRHGIAQLIAAEPDLAVSGEAADRDEALQAISRHKPDFVVLDISLKGKSGSGLELVDVIHELAGPIPILIYSMHDEVLYALRALRAGARGYLMKQEPVRQVIAAIRTVLAGGVFVSEDMQQALLQRHVSPGTEPLPASPIQSLSDREVAVFQYIGHGLQPREIASALVLSVKTVETHRMNIRKKLGLTNASELTRFAVNWMRRGSD
ncbi:response regulator [Desulfonatronum parangueonense]